MKNVEENTPASQPSPARSDKDAERAQPVPGLPFADLTSGIRKFEADRAAKAQESAPSSEGIDGPEFEALADAYGKAWESGLYDAKSKAYSALVAFIDAALACRATAGTTAHSPDCHNAGCDSCMSPDELVRQIAYSVPGTTAAPIAELWDFNPAEASPLDTGCAECNGKKLREFVAERATAGNAAPTEIVGYQRVMEIAHDSCLGGCAPSTLVSFASAIGHEVLASIAGVAKDTK